MKKSTARSVLPVLCITIVLVIGMGQVYAQALGGTPAPAQAPAGQAPIPGAPAGAPAAGPGAAPAPEKFGVKSGDKELLLNGNLNIGIGDNVGTSTGSGSLLVGYYFSPKFEGGLGLFFEMASVMDEVPQTDPAAQPLLTKSTAGTIGPMIFGRYIFHAGQKGHTYFGLEVGLQASRGDNVEATNDWFARPHIGFKHFIKKNVAFDVNFGYKAITSKAENTVSRSDSLDFKLGIAMIF